jgi:hypothetical protein
MVKAENEREAIKGEIERRFDEFVKGLKPPSRGDNRHDGFEGDWLTRQMGLNSNGKNEPDFMGFEMKKDSKGKTTFGDWSPDRALYKAPYSRTVFLRTFGSPNPLKNDRYSWSGKVFPTLGKWNGFGQRLEVDDDQNIRAIYTHKMNVLTPLAVPAAFHLENLELAFWSKEPIGPSMREKGLRRKVEDKFNQLGWFRCLKGGDGTYQRIQFGRPLSYPAFIEMFKRGEIFIDSGMYEGNPRPYMQFRAGNQVWDRLAE